MNYDGFADAEGRIARSNTNFGGRMPSGSAGPPATFALRWLLRVAVALATVWLVVSGVVRALETVE